MNPLNLSLSSKPTTHEIIDISVVKKLNFNKFNVEWWNWKKNINLKNQPK